MLGGFATHVALYCVGAWFEGKMTAYEPFGFHPFLIGSLASLVISIAVALGTPAPPHHLVRKFFYAETPAGR